MNKLLRKKTNELTKKKKKGFTLVELIIVIAIIAILAAIAIPKMGAVRESANIKDDLATAKNISTMIAAEMANNNATYVPGATEKSHVVEDTILNKLDGLKTPQAKTASGGATTFTYTISTDGNISIKYTGGNQIYPAS